jgi:hypothetical protein
MRCGPCGGRSEGSILLPSGSRSIEMKKKRTGRAILVNLSLVLVSTLFAVALVEGSFRIYAHFVPQPFTSHLHFRLSKPPPYAKSEYFSREFIHESFAEPGGWRTDPSFGWYPNDFRGKYFNVTGGRRHTTDSPGPAETKGRVLVFGGSTAYGGEVPDSLTLCSHLQRELNRNGLSGYRVENVGATTITAKQQFARLKMEEIRAGDIVIFYDGVNDVLQSIFYNNPNGNIINSNRKILEGMKPAERFLFKVHRRFSPYSAFVSVSFSPVKALIREPAVDPATVAAAADDFCVTALSADKYCRERGVRFIHFLQPQLFSQKAHSNYEQSVIANPWLVPPGLEKAFRVGYPAFQEALKKIGDSSLMNIDLSTCLETRSEEIYLDFCHITEAGNAIVAKQIFDAIDARFFKRTP